MIHFCELLTRTPCTSGVLPPGDMFQVSELLISAALGTCFGRSRCQPGGHKLNARLCLHTDSFSKKERSDSASGTWHRVLTFVARFLWLCPPLRDVSGPDYPSIRNLIVTVEQDLWRQLCDSRYRRKSSLALRLIPRATARKDPLTWPPDDSCRTIFDLTTIVQLSTSRHQPAAVSETEARGPNRRSSPENTNRRPTLGRMMTVPSSAPTPVRSRADHYS
jgi:hypothetical protein